MAVTHKRGGEFNPDAVPSGMAVAVGFFQHQAYVDGTPVAYVAAIQEFGSPEQKIPPRSFMRTTMTEKARELSSAMQNAIYSIVSRKKGAEPAFLEAGLFAAGLASIKITQIDSPELADSTKAARRRKKKTGPVSYKPLIDTAKMFQSLTAQVVNKYSFK